MQEIRFGHGECLVRVDRCSPHRLYSSASTEASYRIPGRLTDLIALFQEDKTPMRARTLAAVMAVLLLAWPVAAQEQRGTIEGIVKDTSGAVLPGVTVEAKTATGVVLSATTDASGGFRFPSVPPGAVRGERAPGGLRTAEVHGRQRRPRADQAARLRAVARRRHRNGVGHGRIAAHRHQAERASDEHPRRADRPAAARPRLHDARHAGARRQPGGQARRPRRSTARAPARTATSSTASRRPTCRAASRART